MIIQTPDLVEFDFVCPVSHNSLVLSGQHANACSVCLWPLFCTMSSVLLHVSRRLSLSTSVWQKFTTQQPQRKSAKHVMKPVRFKLDLRWWSQLFDWEWTLNLNFLTNVQENPCKLWKHHVQEDHVIPSKCSLCQILNKLMKMKVKMFHFGAKQTPHQNLALTEASGTLLRICSLMSLLRPHCTTLT